MSNIRAIGILHYWGGCPRSPHSKWHRFLEVIRACRQRGWRTYLVWSHRPRDPALSEPFEQAGCRLLLMPRPERQVDPKTILRTVHLLRSLRCQVFHCHNVHTSPLLGAALAGVPVRIWSDLAMSSAYEQGIVPRGLHRWAPTVRLSGALATRVWAISRPVRAELLQLGVPAAKVEVVPVPVDVERCARARPSDIRGPLGLTAADMLIVSVARAVPLKGWDILIEAFAQVRRRMPNAHLLLVGDIRAGEEAAFAGQLRRQADRAGVASAVHLLGQRADIPGLLKAGDIFAFPSRSDGQGLALTEALAAGLPCVAANVGGIPDLITHDYNGLLFEREESAALAGHLLRLLSDGSLRRRLAATAQRDAVRFSMQAYVRRCLDGYTALLRRCRRDLPAAPAEVAADGEP